MTMPMRSPCTGQEPPTGWGWCLPCGTLGLDPRYTEALCPLCEGRGVVKIEQASAGAPIREDGDPRVESGIATPAPATTPKPQSDEEKCGW